MVNARPRPRYHLKRHGTHCIGDWVGPRAGMDGCGKSKMVAEWASEPVCTFCRTEVAISSAGIRTPDKEALSQFAELSAPSLLVT